MGVERWRHLKSVILLQSGGMSQNAYAFMRQYLTRAIIEAGAVNFLLLISHRVENKISMRESERAAAIVVDKRA